MWGVKSAHAHLRKVIMRNLASRGSSVLDEGRNFLVTSVRKTTSERRTDTPRVTCREDVIVEILS